MSAEKYYFLRYEADIAQLKKQLEESSTDIDKIRKDFKTKEGENMTLSDENLSSKKKIDELNQMLENSKLEHKSLQVIITARIRSMGKVMFSQVFVCSQGRGSTRYGQPVGDTHPTVMHTCSKEIVQMIRAD